MWFSCLLSLFMLLYKNDYDIIDVALYVHYEFDPLHV